MSKRDTAKPLRRPVLRLIDCRRLVDSQTIDALRVLLPMAIRGELRGLTAIYRTSDGEERTLLTGVYRNNPDAALAGVLRLSAKVALADV